MRYAHLFDFFWIPRHLNRLDACRKSKIIYYKLFFIVSPPSLRIPVCRAREMIHELRTWNENSMMCCHIFQNWIVNKNVDTQHTPKAAHWHWDHAIRMCCNPSKSQCAYVYSVQLPNDSDTRIFVCLLLSLERTWRRSSEFNIPKKWLKGEYTQSSFLTCLFWIQKEKWNHFHSLKEKNKFSFIGYWPRMMEDGLPKNSKS